MPPSLPTEILFQIVHHVPWRLDLESICLASKVLSDIARRRIWSKFKVGGFTFNHNDVPTPVLDKLEHMLASPHLHPYVHTLYVDLSKLRGDKAAPVHRALMALIPSVPQLRSVTLGRFENTTTNHLIMATLLHTSQKNLQSLVLRSLNRDAPPTRKMPYLLPGTQLELRELVLDFSGLYDFASDTPQPYPTFLVGVILPKVGRLLKMLDLSKGLMGSLDGITFAHLEVFKATMSHGGNDLIQFLARHPSILHLELKCLEVLVASIPQSVPNLNTLIGIFPAIQELAPGRPAQSLVWGVGTKPPEGAAAAGVWKHWRYLDVNRRKCPRRPPRCHR